MTTSASKRVKRCADCKQTRSDVERIPCPYEADVHGRTEMVNLCGACADARAQEI